MSNNTRYLIEKIYDFINRNDITTWNFPPTVIYNENWLLRLVLDTQARGVSCLPFEFLPNSNWYSEAQLPTIFKARKMQDELSEKRTHADGVVGHFTFREGTKADLVLTPESKQFVVIEAKIYSRLSKSVSHAGFFDRCSKYCVYGNHNSKIKS